MRTSQRAALSVVTGIILFIWTSGCGASRQFEAVPRTLDRNNVPTRTVEMTARRYTFSPDTLRVPSGVLLTLRITATDGTHGFALKAYGIDERLEEGVPKEIEIYTAGKGTFPFSCSHFCGIGHFGMDGVLIVE